MNTFHTSVAHLFLHRSNRTAPFLKASLLLAVCLSCLSAAAPTRAQTTDAAPRVDTQVQSDGVVFSAPGARSLRVRVLLGAREIFDSGPVEGARVEWDGRDDAGRWVADGVYVLQVATSDADGQITESRESIALRRAPLSSIGKMTLTPKPLIGAGTLGRIPKWLGPQTLGDSVLFESAGKIGIGTTAPTAPLSVRGQIHSSLGGYKFPDGSTQITAGLPSVAHDLTLLGLGTTRSPLSIAPNRVTGVHLSASSVTGIKIAPKSVVKSLNGLFDAVTLVPGSNVTITKSGNTLIIAAKVPPSGLASVAHDATLVGNGGSAPLGIAPGGVGNAQLAAGAVTSDKLAPGGIRAPQLADGAVTGAKIAPGQVVRSVNGLSDGVTLTPGANVTITPSGNTLTVAAPNALAGVAHDGTLAGVGTAASPLSVSVPLVLSNDTQRQNTPLDLQSYGVTPAVTAYSEEGNAIEGVSNANRGKSGVLGIGYLGSVGVTGMVSPYGANAGAIGVVGVNQNGIGVKGISVQESGIYGITEGRAYNPDAAGVFGNGTLAYGVRGQSTQNDGVYGITGATGKAGISGVHTGDGAGVAGTGASGVGVYGTSTNNDGVYGVTGAAAKSAIIGVHTSSGYGVYGQSSSGIGVYGTSATNDGIYGTTGAAGKSAVIGVHTSSGYGVYGQSSSGYGVFGTSATNDGIYGTTGAAGKSAIIGIHSNSGTGVRAHSDSGNGVHGSSSGAGAGVRGENTSTGFAGYFNGNVHVTGTLSKSVNTFKIDHPLDPGNKYLSHSVVESPDMMNIYNGNARLNARGEAVVMMPDYFSALNRDFRYQLTAIGAPGPNLYVAQKINGNKFKIAGGKPNSEVSWQVTGVRQDAYAKAHPIRVSEAKVGSERGAYLHPELFGQPKSKAIGYVKAGGAQPKQAKAGAPKATPVKRTAAR